jgi:hypothetical protein
MIKSFWVGVFFASCILHIDAIAQDAKPPLVMKPSKAIEPLARLVGDYETACTEFRDPANANDDVKTKGSVSCKLLARGQAFSIAKQSPLTDNTLYDDLMVFQNDQAAGKLKAILFHPNAPGPRQIDVEVKDDGSLVLNYQPTQFGDKTIVTRETITLAADGKVTWLIERKAADDTYVKVREIVGTKKSSK